MRVDISSFEMLFAELFSLVPPKVFFQSSISQLLGTLSVCNGQFLVQLFLRLWDETLLNSDGF